ncbi:hypothetical protein GPECTOR_79g111 [Gonium pectorale]|uniref:Transmembrane protein n=1 Tax=Gonium pectorale TaxID=33097 RepID=A0A150G1T9_GONPE|nr:hypothetical protein GPECTOR_79g111 [Gonium pectorale]|eukprot:KXZ43832.1 hypothetical protein GPECTOR_79g111 [Gonium pectorale]
MPCPFGFTADDGDEDEEVTSEEDEEEEAGSQDEKAEGSETGGEGKVTKKDKKKKEAFEEAKPEVDKADGPKEKKNKKKVQLPPEDMKFDFDKDPVSWFYQNQIKSEAEFAKRKDALRAEARKRLDQIMSKKNKSVDWPSDSDLDELSIRSSELCANSWIEDARYGTPAEKTLKCCCYIAMAALCYSLYLTMHAVNTTRKVAGVLVFSAWPSASFLAGGLLGATYIGALLAVRYRSRRFLLASQSAMLALYSTYLVIVVGVVLQPTAVDAKLRDVACVRYSKTDQGSRLCKMLPGIERDLSEQMYGLKWAGGLAAISALSCLVSSVWYLYELSYIEKRAIKHKRRHKRRKHTIPWDKIKIVGPVTNCGSAGAKGAGAGKCPVAHTGGAAPASKCPVAGFGAAKPVGLKKND